MRGAATCARLRMLNCESAAQCGMLFDADTILRRRECFAPFDVYGECLDRAAPSATCEQFPVGNLPTICTAELAAVNACLAGDAGAPTDASDAGEALLGSITAIVMVRTAETLPETLSVVAKRGAPPTCVEMAREGACVYRLCAGGEDPRPNVSAGAVSFGNGTDSVSLEPDGMLRYSDRSANFAPGGMVDVRVAGAGMIPAFEAQLPLPMRSARLEFSAPRLGGEYERSSPLLVRWTAEAIGSVEVTVSLADYNLACSAPARDGQVTIPPSLLMLLPSARFLFDAEQRTSATTTTAGWRLDTSVRIAYIGTTPITLL
ncbi:MAG: hypothetical protein JNK05_42000 [Myxococcales bacterium]|nr:hypothetical protein [Myxococcales bacterium]